jgi:hypothetical protein
MKHRKTLAGALALALLIAAAPSAIHAEAAAPELSVTYYYLPG